MLRSAARKKDWTLTKEAFERLLDSLDANRERAGEKYENVRRKLIEFFEARGSNSPADHADQTINRVAKRLEEGEGVKDISAYSYGVARFLLKETLRGRGKEPLTLDLAPAPLIVTDENEDERRHLEEARLKCFEVCLSNLPAASRVLIIEYYREEKGIKIEQRKRQADALNMSLNALRLRACRIRAELGDCITSCLDRSREDTKSVIRH